MSLFHCPWFIAGRWALDLALGEKTRPHHDVDICCFRENIGDILKFFTGWNRQVAIPEENRLTPITCEKDLSLPRHELHFQKENQHIEILLIGKENSRVLFRREPSISLDLSDFF
jgi:hypothetical protein